MTTTLPRRAFLGAELPGDTDAFTSEGLRVAGVVTGGMAERAGLVAGDVIISLAGAPLRDLRELATALRIAGGRSSVEIATTRGARTVEVVALPCESGVVLGELAVAGARLRTLETRVEDALALVLVIQGIATESIDHATAPDAALAGLVAGWARAGIASLRFDKRGAGDSEGEPGDFATELADARAALELARARGVSLAVFGHSVGGIIAAQIAPDVPLVVFGTPVMRWLDCLADSTRRQMALRGASEPEIERAVAALGELERTGELNGRSAAYHAQLHALDLAAAWSRVTAPVLVVRGEHDWVVRADDQARIATLARGVTMIADVPGLDHVMGWHPDRAASLRDYGAGRFDPAIVAATAAWIVRSAR